MKLGRFNALLEQSTANHKIADHEWNIIYSRMMEIRIKLSKFSNNETYVKQVIIESLNKVYALIGRRNIPVADKRKVIMLLAMKGTS